MIRRDEGLRELAKHRGDAIVVAVYNAAFDLRRVSPSPLNYYSVGAMGLASSHGLGLALGLPSRKVIVVDGDGSLLMNVGSLVTIANQAPRNLYHFVGENGCYEANGSHPIPGQGRLRFSGIAHAAGYPHVFEFDDLDRFATELPRILSLTGPVFTTLKIVPGEPSPLDYEFIHGKQTRQDFKAAIASILAGKG